MIQIENLSFRYDQKQGLFDQLSLKMPPGSIYGLLGKNGAGKTTLLKIISGLLFPKQGEIDVLGYRPMKRYPQFLREIYLITEEFYLPSYTIDLYVRLNSPFYPRFDHGLFQEYVNELHLPRDQKLSAMSYGQKKNFLLSFGLATDCNLLLLDEPTNGLDIPSKSQFRKMVANAIHEKRTFIISTHQVRDMENLIDPVIILDNGKIVFFQDYEEITKKIAITRQSELPDDESLIYSESSLGSYTVVKVNSGSEETNMSLETLFNAVISNTNKINEIFKN
ncbi:MAG: ABC transporter ATP-binding protein [Bacteroidales bacterium]|jgi:ABC-2 type transport system ATP-binding protein